MSAVSRGNRTASAPTRTERDPLGEVRVPSGAYYGVQTQRAVDNFPISGLRAPAELVTATVLIKQACARGERVRSDRLDRRVADAIITAADEVLHGRLRDQFVVDVYQAGAGTSHNMNANEVLANRAAEILGEPRGIYTRVHPNDHVNMGQSTNDVFPTATRLAILLVLPTLVDAARALADALEAQGARVRERAEDRADASAGRGSDHARAGIQRMERERPARDGRTGALRRRAARTESRHPPPSGPD